MVIAQWSVVFRNELPKPSQSILWLKNRKFYHIKVVNDTIIVETIEPTGLMAVWLR